MACPDEASNFVRWTEKGPTEIMGVVEDGDPFCAARHEDDVDRSPVSPFRESLQFVSLTTTDTLDEDADLANADAYSLLTANDA